MSGQPGPSGQQPQASHDISNGGATGARGTFTQAEIARLAESKGYNQDLTQYLKFQVIPVWSEERWDGKYQGSTDGFTFKARQLGLGDFVMGNRPAIRPEEEHRNPTEYARRFGILDKLGSRDGLAHSGLTPTDPAFQASAQRPEADAFDESLQAIFFEYTSSELVAQGAFNPRLPVTWPPDINEDVHDLVARYRWDQKGPQPAGWWDGVWDVRYGSILNGTPGQYDAMRNQAVWDAIEPALKLVSRIIRSDHPYWLAMTSMFHMRPVPDAKDGRTPSQKADQGGRPYTSVWLDDNEDDPRIPAPYPEMARLKSLGFDSAVSRDVCLEILSANLKFKIVGMEAALAITTAYDDWNILISLNAGMIWGLLMDRHVSNSEKAAFTFDIVNCMLHEIAHACALVHRDLTSRPHLIYSTTFGPQVTPEMWASLVQLGDEIYGPLSYYYGQTFLDRPLPRQQLFVEDECQGEEGLNFEKQLWGDRVSPHHAFGGPEFSLAPLLMLVPFPCQHPQPLQQGLTMQDQEDRAYQRYLTDPRAPSWNELLAIPVQWYARYFANGWWQTDFQKFQHHGLRLSTNDPKLPTSLLRTNGQEQATTGNKEDMAIVFGAEAWDWLYGTVLAMLEQRDRYILSVYLQTLIGLAAQAKLFATKFENEMQSWPHKYRGIVRAAHSVSDDYQVMVADIYSHLLPGSAAFDFASTGIRIREINNSIRRVMGPMLELNRLMTQDVSYQQFILTQYLQLDEGIRRSFHANMQQLTQMMARSLSLLGGQEPDIILQFSTISPEVEGSWVNMLEQKLITDLLGGNAQQAARNNLPQDAVAEAEIFIDLMNEIKLLHRSFNTHHNLLFEMHSLLTNANANSRVPDSAEWPRIQSFARARRQRRTKVIEPAAVREISQIDDRALATMVYEALALLSTKLDPATMNPAQTAIKSAIDRRATRQTALMERWRLFLRNQKMAMLQRERAREAGLVGVVGDPTMEALLGEMRTMAEGVGDDERLLDSMYSVDTIQETLNLIALDLAI